jgi:hypothetical protein
MTVIDRLQRAMHMESAAIAPRTSEAIEAMRAGIAEIERLGEVVRQRTFLLDQQMGTPCEQIRHQQEVERLTTENERLRAALRAISTTSIWTGDAGSQQTYEGVRAYARDALNPPSDSPDD